MTRPTPLIIIALAAVLLLLALVACGGGDNTTAPYDPTAPRVLPTSPPELSGWFCAPSAESAGIGATPTPVCRPLPPTPATTPEAAP